MTINIVAFMNSYTQGKSGGDMVFIEIAKRMKDCTINVVTSKLGADLCKKYNLHAKYIITTSEKKFNNVLWIYLKRIIGFFLLRLSVQKGDLLLGTSDFLPDVLPLFWLKIRHKQNKWIQHIFHLTSKTRKLPFVSQRISITLIKYFSDLIIVDSYMVKKDLVKMGFNQQIIKVNHPGINLKNLQTFKKRPKEFDAVYMAQLRQVKGIFDLIKIWKYVCKIRPGAQLRIIGKGTKEMLFQLKEKIKKNQLQKNVKLLGFLDDEDAFSIIGSSKIFLFPSHEEGFGIAALEAQALSLPVVAWDLPVYTEIFPRGMIKVSRNNVRELAQQVIELLKDMILYKRLSRDASYNASHFNWDKTAQIEYKLLKKMST